MIGLCVATTAADYAAAFATEQRQTYPMVDAFEIASGYKLDRSRLESAARVLSCPVKKSPPNWQHGRVLYAAASRYLATHCEDDAISILDIGTAKGFSALCLLWAMKDFGFTGHVTSVDVIDPHSRVERKTVSEIEGYRFLTLAETLAPWPESDEIRFEHSTGIDWLEAHPERVHIAFVDGSHDGPEVLREGQLMAARQQTGDLAIFDDLQRPGIAFAVQSMGDLYRLDYLDVLPTRRYAIGVRL